MKNLILLFLLASTVSAFAQNRHHEITDFNDKWTLDVSDMKKLEINSLAGNLKIIGVKTNELKIKAYGPDTYKLTGGATGLGFILSKNKKGNYRIQGIVSNHKEFEITYEIQIPNAVLLKMQSGSRYFDTSIWSITNMKFPMQLEKIKGTLLIDGVEKTLANWNFKGERINIVN